MTKRKYLYPYRTQKSSSLVLKILAGYPAGKIGSRQFLYSSLAQLVEHAAVNRRVVSSSLTRGAKKEIQKSISFLFRLKDACEEQY